LHEDMEATIVCQRDVKDEGIRETTD